MKLSPNTAPPVPGDLLIRLHNQVGAAVDVTGSCYGRTCRWLCHGCGDSSDMPETDALLFVRPRANGHAAACRGSYHRTP